MPAMSTPPSTLFQPVSLDRAFNADRRALTGPLRPPSDDGRAFGAQVFHGIPFELGSPNRANVVLLDEHEVVVEVGDMLATYVLFVHAVEDSAPAPLPDSNDFAGALPRAGEAEGNLLGGRVSEYRLEYGDGTTAEVPILRRFAIQQSRITWGASPFAAISTQAADVFPTASEAQQLGRVPRHIAGRAEVRHRSGRDSAEEHLWLYALPNPHPDKPVARLILSPQGARSLVYAVSCTQVDEHPLRRNPREKLKLALPEGAGLNALGELEEIDIDLGTVISARAHAHVRPRALARRRARRTARAVGRHGRRRVRGPSQGASLHRNRVGGGSCRPRPGGAARRRHGRRSAGHPPRAPACGREGIAATGCGAPPSARRGR